MNRTICPRCEGKQITRTLQWDGRGTWAPCAWCIGVGTVASQLAAPVPAAITQQKAA